MTKQPTSPSEHDDGWRARKREQTRQRIAEAALRLFLDNGFDATTLDAIAESAGIARRTFFHYFDSKEAVLAVYLEEAEQSFREAFTQTPGSMSPFEAMKSAMLRMISTFGTEKARDIDNVMRSTEALRARNQANFERLERFVGTVLMEKWPDPADYLRMRTIAMVGIGTLRIAAERWKTDNSVHCLHDYLNDGFVALLSTVIR